MADKGPGQEIAVSRVPALGKDGLSAEVYSIATTGTTSGQTTKLYQNPPGVISLIADNTPHYMYWSPTAGT